MLLSLVVFVLVTGGIIGAYLAWTILPGLKAKRQLEERLRDAEHHSTEAEKQSTVLRQEAAGPLPSIDRLIARTGAGTGLSKLIEQTGMRITPGTFAVLTVLMAAMGSFILGRAVRLPFMWALGAALGGALPTLWLFNRRRARLKRFEEQFPEALDLLARALRAGHALQAALGMVAEELPAPVGIEFRKTFEQQNFGLPLNEALNELAVRVPLMDVRFFATAIAIQRDTGGNLAEILDNLAAVVRERFKILRQVRVHTAHGRFTGYVLLALPAALAIVLSFINPGHMNLLFQEHMGRMMLGATVVMQTVGYFWIRQVIKIEV